MNTGMVEVVTGRFRLESFRPWVVSAWVFRPESIQPWVVSANFGGSFRPDFIFILTYCIIYFMLDVYVIRG